MHMDLLYDNDKMMDLDFRTSWSSNGPLALTSTLTVSLTNGDDVTGSFDFSDAFGNASLVFLVSDVLDARMISRWDGGHVDTYFHAFPGNYDDNVLLEHYINYADNAYTSSAAIYTYVAPEGN